MLRAARAGRHAGPAALAVALVTSVGLAERGAAAGQYQPGYSRAPRPLLGPGPYDATDGRLAWLAEPRGTVLVRRSPTARSSAIARIGARLPSRRPRRLLVSGSGVDARGALWLRVVVRGGVAPTQGWLAASLVHVRSTSVRVDVRTGAGLLTILVAGRVRHRMRVGTGATGTPTPLGRFAVIDVARFGTIAARSNGRVAIRLNGTTATPNELRTPDRRFAIIGVGRNSLRLLRPGTTFGSVRTGSRGLARVTAFVSSGVPVNVLP